MEAEARRQTAFAHRRGASSSKGGSRRGGFSSDAPNDRLSPAGACRGQCARGRAELSARPSDTCSGRRQNPPGECLWLVRAYRTRALWAYVVRSRRPRQMVDYGSVEDHALQRTCSTCKDPAGNGWRSAASGFAEIEPPAPILALEDDHLAIMDRRNVRARSRGQQGEGGSAVGHRSPEPGEAKPVFSSLRELPF